MTDIKDVMPEGRGRGCVEREERPNAPFTHTTAQLYTGIDRYIKLIDICTLR